MEFMNSYEDTIRADSYSKLEFPNTYYLAYRDLPEIISTHVKGRKAIDFGCGTGRSTRFLKKIGFQALGIDIAENMIKKAKELDPKGDYLLVKNGVLNLLGYGLYDLVLSVFTFDNIPTMENRIKLMNEIGRLLNNNGKLILLDSTPELYINEWASFSTLDFPQNITAKSGDKVRVIMKDVEDARPVDDIFWTYEDYIKCFKQAKLKLIATYKPLANKGEPYQWINETKIAPWIIYVLKKL